jgi:hypothetical protein
VDKIFDCLCADYGVGFALRKCRKVLLSSWLSSVVKQSAWKKCCVSLHSVYLGVLTSVKADYPQRVWGRVIVAETNTWEPQGTRSMANSLSQTQLESSSKGAGADNIVTYQCVEGISVTNGTWIYLLPLPPL